MLTDSTGNQFSAEEIQFVMQLLDGWVRETEVINNDTYATWYRTQRAAAANREHREAAGENDDSLWAASAVWDHAEPGRSNLVVRFIPKDLEDSRFRDDHLWDAMPGGFMYRLNARTLFGLDKA